jgi:hypothetical protein
LLEGILVVLGIAVEQTFDRIIDVIFDRRKSSETWVCS